MKPVTSFNEQQKGGVLTILNLILADECLLYSRTRNCRCDMVGPEFKTLQELFEKQYDELSDIIDDVSERVQAIGGYAMGTMSEFLQHTRLQAQPGSHPSSARMTSRLLDDHLAMIRTLRDDTKTCVDGFGDALTGDLLKRLMEQHQRMAQALRAQLENS